MQRAVFRVRCYGIVPPSSLDCRGDKLIKRFGLPSMMESKPECALHGSEWEATDWLVERNDWYNDRILETFISSPDIDKQNDKVPTSAIKNALDFYMKYGVYSWKHDEMPIGLPLAYKIEKDKVKLKIGIHDSLPMHDKCWDEIKELGKLGSSSIRGEALDRKVVCDSPSNCYNLIDKLGLWSVSWVGDNPANSEAKVTFVSVAKGYSDKCEVHGICKDCGLKKQGALPGGDGGGGSGTGGSPTGAGPGAIIPTLDEMVAQMNALDAQLEEGTITLDAYVAQKKYLESLMQQAEDEEPSDLGEAEGEDETFVETDTFTEDEYSEYETIEDLETWYYAETGRVSEMRNDGLIGGEELQARMEILNETFMKEKALLEAGRPLSGRGDTVTADDLEVEETTDIFTEGETVLYIPPGKTKWSDAVEGTIEKELFEKDGNQYYEITGADGVTRWVMADYVKAPGDSEEETAEGETAEEETEELQEIPKEVAEILRDTSSFDPPEGEQERENLIVWLYGRDNQTFWKLYHKVEGWEKLLEEAQANYDEHHGTAWKASPEGETEEAKPEEEAEEETEEAKPEQTQEEWEQDLYEHYTVYGGMNTMQLARYHAEQQNRWSADELNSWSDTDWQEYIQAQNIVGSSLQTPKNMEYDFDLHAWVDADGTTYDYQGNPLGMSYWDLYYQANPLPYGYTYNPNTGEAFYGGARYGMPPAPASPYGAPGAAYQQPTGGEAGFGDEPQGEQVPYKLVRKDGKFCIADTFGVIHACFNSRQAAEQKLKELLGG